MQSQNKYRFTCKLLARSGAPNTKFSVTATIKFDYCWFHTWWQWWVCTRWHPAMLLDLTLSIYNFKYLLHVSANTLSSCIPFYIVNHRHINVSLAYSVRICTVQTQQSASCMSEHDWKCYTNEASHLTALWVVITNSVQLHNLTGIVLL